MALAQVSLHPDTRRIVIVADGDGAPDQARRRIQEGLRDAAIPSDVDFLTMVIDPSLEEALMITLREKNPERLAQSLAQSDVQGLAARNSDLRQLLEVLGLIK